MAKLLYVFQTEDPLEATDIAKRLGINLTNIVSAPGALATGHNPIPVAPAAEPPRPHPPAAPAPLAVPVAPPPAAAAPPPPAPAAPPAHTAADQAIIDSGWSLDAHVKPIAQAVIAKFGNEGPATLKAVLDKYQPGAKITTLAAQHWPAVHAELTALHG